MSADDDKDPIGKLALYLLELYRHGVFPMAPSRDSPEIHVVRPRMRCIFDVTRFRLSRRLRRTIRSEPYEVRFNCNFPATIRACADLREETWINEPILQAYTVLHGMGLAHSVETYEDDRLVGGLYGLCAFGMFYGESMFSIRRDSSKIALAYLADRLNQCRIGYIDAQFPTTHLESLGAIVIPQDDYLALLRSQAHRAGNLFDGQSPADSGSEVVQRISQTS